jgi:hypothetical protein
MREIDDILIETPSGQRSISIGQIVDKMQDDFEDRNLVDECEDEDEQS